MAVNHPWRTLTTGLLKIGEVSTRELREEHKVLIDPYADEAIRDLASQNVLLELQGWARSYYTLDGHMDAILKYERPKIVSPDDAAWNTTVQAVTTMMSRWPKCRTKSYKEFDSVRWLRSSAAGYGYPGRKGENDNYHIAKRTAVTICEKILRSDENLIEALQNSTPDVAFTRTQLSQIKVKKKVRNVWGEAFHYVLLEGLFTDNLIEYFKEMDSFYYIGKDPLVGVPALVTEIMKDYDIIYQFDWSAFDASVQEWEIRASFDILETILNFDSPVEKRIWLFITELFIYRKVACPDGSLRLKTQGIPSGSCFTNMLGSIVNYLRIQFLFTKHTGDFACAYTHGDDSIVGALTKQTLHPRAFEPECSKFNWDLNADKTRISSTREDVEFLSRSLREGVNFREELVCLRMLLYPEYEVEEGPISTLCALSILEDSGLHSKLLFRVYQYLNFKYGSATELPIRYKRWDVLEYDALREPYLV